MSRNIRSALIVIALNNLVMTLGFRLWQSLFNNFAVEILSIQADQIGWIQAIREIPGLLGFLVGILALFLAEMRIAGISVILMGTGIYLTASSQDLSTLILTTLIMSVGFHFFYSSNSSAVLLTVGPKEAPKMLGRLNSLGSLAAVLSSVLVFATLETWGFETLYRVTGGVVALAGLALLPFGRQPVRVQRTQRRVPLRREYGLYYGLQFLMGSRRHIFTTFATFLLVQTYGVTAQIITMLFLINNLIGTYLHQAFGKIVARFGEKRVLTFNFCLLILIFLGYAFIPVLDALKTPTWQIPALSIGEWVLIPTFLAAPALLILLGFFIVDHVLFGFSIAVECYFQKIALGPEDITANVTVGQAINHVAAVIVPVVGGAIWAALGSSYTFLTGVAIAVVTLVLVQRIRTGRASCAIEPAVKPG